MAIEHISDTARWVAVYRAMESERTDAIFRDPFARRLAGVRGEEIVRAMPRGAQMSWSMIVRTAMFDEIIMQTVRGRGADTVLNLAAGLDTRAWRLDLPSSLRWVDVDLPDILQYKTELMKEERPRCHYEAIPTDLTDSKRRAALFAIVAREAQRAIVVTEGLLVYLQPLDVESLGRAVHDQPAFRWWLLDLASPRLLKIMLKWWGRQVEQGNAPFVFAPEEGSKFFERSGWREVEWRSTMDEAHRLKREMRGMWLWRLLGRLQSRRKQEEYKRFSGTLLLERA